MLLYYRSIWSKLNNDYMEIKMSRNLLMYAVCNRNPDTVESCIGIIQFKLRF